MNMHPLRHVIQVLIGVISLWMGLACQPTFNWAVSVGSNSGSWFSADEGKSTAIDAAGNVYVTGKFFGTVDFDPGSGVVNLVAGANSSAFIAKYTPMGMLLWAKKIDAVGFFAVGGAQSITVDSSANVYVAGAFGGTVDFDPGPGIFNLTSTASFVNAYVLKLTSTGSFVWARRMGGTGHSEAIAVSVNSGFVYTTGRFSDTSDFDPGPGVFNLTGSAFPQLDAFVSKLNDVGGTFVWARSYGGTSTVGGSGIASDASGNVYVTGTFANTLVMGSFTLTGAGGQESFVAKLNSVGTVVFAGKLGGASTFVNSTCIAVDQAGNMIVAGYFQGPADFDPGPGTFNLVSATNHAFVLKLNPIGSFLWARNLGATGFQVWAWEVAVDTTGNIYTTGFFRGTTDFNPGAGTFNLTPAGNADAFIWKLDASGAYGWAGRLGGPSFDSGYGIAVRSCATGSTQVDVTGSFRASGDFDPTTGTMNLVNSGDHDIFTSQVTFPTSTVAQHLYASSQGRVLKYPIWGPPLPPPAVFVPLGSGGPSQPMGLTFGPDCNLYVSNFSANQVMRYNGSTGAPLSSAGNSGAVFVSSQSGGLVTPHGLTFGVDGRLYVSSIGTTSDVLRYDGVTGALDVNFTGLNPPVYARGVTFGGPAGDLYVTSDHNIQRFNRITGALDTSWNLATDPNARTHYDLKFGPGGDLYVTAFETSKVLRFNGTTGAPLPDFVPAGSGGLARPIGLAFGPDGNLYVSSAGTNQILRYNGTTGAFIGVFASGVGLAAPGYLVFGP